MTADEAIKHLTFNEIYTDDWEEAVLEAKEALEKQIPKKPTKSEREITYVEVWECPACGFEFFGRVVDYCYRCGQKIDWSAANDG